MIRSGLKLEPYNMRLYMTTDGFHLAPKQNVKKSLEIVTGAMTDRSNTCVLRQNMTKNRTRITMRSTFSGKLFQDHLVIFKKDYFISSSAYLKTTGQLHLIIHVTSKFNII